MRHAISVTTIAAAMMLAGNSANAAQCQAARAG